MLAIIETHPELEKLHDVIPQSKMLSVVNEAAKHSMPVLLDLETLIMRPVNINYTSRSYDLIFRGGKKR